MGWACSGEEVWERCGKCLLLSAQICKKKKTQTTLGVVSKALNPDEGMVLCLDMENSCLVSSQRLCVLCAYGPRVLHQELGEGDWLWGDQEDLVQRLHRLSALSAWY